MSHNPFDELIHEQQKLLWMALKEATVIPIIEADMALVERLRRTDVSAWNGTCNTQEPILLPNETLIDCRTLSLQQIRTVFSTLMTDYLLKERTPLELQTVTMCDVLLVPKCENMQLFRYKIRSATQLRTPSTNLFIGHQVIHTANMLSHSFDEKMGIIDFSLVDTTVFDLYLVANIEESIAE